VGPSGVRDIAEKRRYNGGAMKSRFRVGVLLVALAAQLLAPLAAYAMPVTAPGADDFCSAIRNASAARSTEPALPRPAAPDHGSSHCAFCCGSASPAVLTSAFSLAVIDVVTEAPLPQAARVPAVSPSILLPPLRGPPGLS
jgi:hypothetical protein